MRLTRTGREVDAQKQYSYRAFMSIIAITSALSCKSETGIKPNERKGRGHGPALLRLWYWSTAVPERLWESRLA